MRRIRNLFHNALIRFGMKRRILRVSTLVTLLVSVLGVGGILMMTYSSEYTFGGMNANDMADFGQIAFIIIAIVHASLVLLLSATASAAEISGEKQRQTIDLLVCSQMTPGEIIVGKLFSSFSYTILISLVMLPVYAILYLFGGINPLAIVTVYALMLFFGCVLSSLALWFSSVYSKSAAAILMTLLVVFIICGGNGLLELLVRFVDMILQQLHVISYPDSYNSSYTDIPWVLQFNPVTFIILVVGLCFDAVTIPDNSNGELIEYIITLVFTPVFCALVTWFSIRMAKKHINPYKANPRKG